MKYRRRRNGTKTIDQPAEPDRWGRKSADLNRLGVRLRPTPTVAEIGKLAVSSVFWVLKAGSALRWSSLPAS